MTRKPIAEIISELKEHPSYVGRKCALRLLNAIERMERGLREGCACGRLGLTGGYGHCHLCNVRLDAEGILNGEGGGDF